MIWRRLTAIHRLGLLCIGASIAACSGSGAGSMNPPLHASGAVAVGAPTAAASTVAGTTSSTRTTTVAITIQRPKTGSAAARSAAGSRSPQYIASNANYLFAWVGPASASMLAQASPSPCVAAGRSCTFNLVMPIGASSTLEVDLLNALPADQSSTYAIVSNLATTKIALSQMSYTPTEGVNNPLPAFTFAPVLSNAILTINNQALDNAIVLGTPSPIYTWLPTPSPTASPIAKVPVLVQLQDVAGVDISPAGTSGVVDASGNLISSVVLASNDPAFLFDQSLGSGTPQTLTLSLANVTNFSSTTHLLDYVGGSAQIDVGNPSFGTAGSGQVTITGSFVGSSTPAFTNSPFVLGLKQPYLYVTNLNAAGAPFPPNSSVGLPSNTATITFSQPTAYIESLGFGLFENLDSRAVGGAIAYSNAGCPSVIDTNSIAGGATYLAGGSFTSGATMPTFLLLPGTPSGSSCTITATDALGASATFTIDINTTNIIVQGNRRK